jgi:hypothetical protein
LPSADLGPRDLAPFLRLAAARALLTGVAARAGASGAEAAARGAAPIRDMAGFLRVRGCLEEGLAAPGRPT